MHRLLLQTPQQQLVGNLDTTATETWRPKRYKGEPGSFTLTCSNRNTKQSDHAHQTTRIYICMEKEAEKRVGEFYE